MDQKLLEDESEYFPHLTQGSANDNTKTGAYPDLERKTSFSKQSLRSSINDCWKFILIIQ